MSEFISIIWYPDPEIFNVLGREIRWYGLFFALAFFAGMQIMTYIFKKENRNLKILDSLIIYVIAATVIGARLGHCLFYEPDHYLSNPMEILYIWEGGLASHGAAFGIFFSIYLFVKKHKGLNYIQVLDRLAIVVALGGAFIRFGNFTNSEIIGKPSDGPSSVVFAYDLKNYISSEYDENLDAFSIIKTNKYKEVGGIKYPQLKADILLKRTETSDAQNTLSNMINVIPSLSINKNIMIVPFEVDLQVREGKGNKVDASFYFYGIPRHPAQLYESLSSFLLFIILFLVYQKFKGNVPEGRIFGLFLIILFTLRFFYEFLKENQVSFEKEMSLNMGQILSAPLVLAGIFILIRSLKKAN